MLLKTFSAFLAYCIVVPTMVLSRRQQNIPLCPPKQAREYSFPYVIYGNSPARCYVASNQGPCSEGSILFAKPRSPFGVCSCECFRSDGIVFDDSSFQQYRYCYNRRTSDVYVYDKKRCSCYKLGSQGPCPSGQVLHKDIYETNPKCVKEDISSSPHTPIETESSTTATAATTSSTGGNTCPPGTIFSTLLNICTDMSFTGLPPSTPTTTRPSNGGNTCPPGTIYSTLLNICTDMSFTGLPPSSSSATTSYPGGNTCPPGTIYSTLLNICTDMSFTGLPPSSTSATTSSSSTGGSTCPPGTIYSTLLNICTDMNFTGLPPSSSSATTPSSNTCPPGTIYSTLLNICTDMSFTGLPPSTPSSGAYSRRCPQGTIYSTLLNRCTDMNFRGLVHNSL